MLTLKLGVIDQPYADAAEHEADLVRHGKAGGKNRGSLWRRSDFIGGEAPTTAGVARILEDEYHIMEIFAEVHHDDIAADLANSYAGAIDTMFQTGLPPPDPAASATTMIEERMKDWISNQEMEKLGYPGVPTQAALDGVNHRLKNPRAKGNPRRPSFRDTGLYQASMKVWTEE